MVKKNTIVTLLAIGCRTFAYKTVKDRLPSILVGVIDSLHKEKERVTEEHGTVRVVVVSVCCLSDFCVNLSGL